MKIDVLTLFPQMFEGVFSSSILDRAQKKGLVKLAYHDLREYSNNAQRQVDDYPFGGGAGMLMQIEPFDVFFATVYPDLEKRPHIIYLSPTGKTLTQSRLNELAQKEHMLLICGHYEGLDQRVIDTYVDEEISLGDFVLTGGEIAAMALIDGTVRLLPSVLGDNESSLKESFMDGLLEHPHYTRPAVYKSLQVPSVLLEGNHKAIELWRSKESLRRTYLVRPDLLLHKALNKEEKKLLAEVLKEESQNRQE